jgi:hypothetical protein
MKPIKSGLRVCQDINSLGEVDLLKFVGPRQFDFDLTSLIHSDVTHNK